MPVKDTAKVPALAQTTSRMRSSDWNESITDDLELLLDALPPHICEPLKQRDDNFELLEIVMDLGRLPRRATPAARSCSPRREVTTEDIDYVVARIGEFGDDNRAGIERTLHRISCIRNRRGQIVGLTCRVGRAVFGTIQRDRRPGQDRQEHTAARPPRRRQDDDAARSRARARRRHGQARRHRRHLERDRRRRRHPAPGDRPGAPHAGARRRRCSTR